MSSAAGAEQQLSVKATSAGQKEQEANNFLEKRFKTDANPALSYDDTVQLALGSTHALALKQGGAVFSWGRGSYGRLGLGSSSNRLSPTEITGLGTDNAYIAAQANGGMALKSDGRLFNWGKNGDNQLGDGTTTDRLSPVELAAVGSDNAHVVGGYYHALLLKADGSVLSWGYNRYGQIGNGGTTNQVRSCQCIRAPV